jgi:hypothetical protein
MCSIRAVNTREYKAEEEKKKRKDGGTGVLGIVVREGNKVLGIRPSARRVRHT